MSEDNGTIRTFETGATRDTAQDKLDFEGFDSPLVELRFAQYMHEHRKQSDGSLRDSDNWQKGIPLEAYMKSLHRHFMDLRLHHRGYPHLAAESDIEKVLCAILFNVKGYLFELLKGTREQMESDLGEAANHILDLMDDDGVILDSNGWIVNEEV